MKELWEFVSQPQNLAVLVAVAGGIGFVWTKVWPSKPPPKADTCPTATQQAEAGSGGVAVNAADSARVTVQHNKPPGP